MLNCDDYSTHFVPLLFRVISGLRLPIGSLSLTPGDVPYLIGICGNVASKSLADSFIIQSRDLSRLQTQGRDSSSIMQRPANRSVPHTFGPILAPGTIDTATA